MRERRGRRKGTLSDCYGCRAFRNIESPEFSCRLACVTKQNPTPTTEVGVLLIRCETARGPTGLPANHRTSTGAELFRAAGMEVRPPCAESALQRDHGA